MHVMHLVNPITRPVALVIALLLMVSAATAGDLPAAGDGQHLWLIQQAPPPENDKDAQPALTLYHLPADTEQYLARKLDPITGTLMPRGLAAGDNTLLLITNDRQLTAIRPIWSELRRSWVYQKRSLPALPEGCTLLSLAQGEHGPWALVQVQSRELLETLDQQPDQTTTPTDQQMLNKALGLPEELQWLPPGTPEPTDESSPDPSTDEAAQPQVAQEQPPAEPAEVSEPAEVALPAYRLIHLSRSRWISSPLPEGFTMPREVKLLLRPGDDRPTMLVDHDTSRGQALVRYSPVQPAERPDQDSDASAEQSTDARPEAPAWVRLPTGMQLWPGRQWSAALVNDQIVVALERYRPREVVTIDTFLLRGNDTYEIGYVNINIGDNARWALMPRKNDIALIASPAPPPTDPQANVLPTLALLTGLSLDGQPMFQNEAGQALLMPISELRPSAFEGNADLLVLCLTLIAAMFMMAMFYRRAPQPDQIELPDHLVLAGFGRRAMAAMIDLTPGFILASLIYNLSVGQIVFEAWPGNGIDKAFAAMRPGFVVIGVTLLHTTVCEFILARSLGKILMGLYVADLRGKPAPPMPCLGRALSKVFELFAPPMILLAMISPARQRLGDILAKTTVVMRKPEPPALPEDNDDY